MEGDQADLNIVQGEHLVKVWQVGGHLVMQVLILVLLGLPGSGLDCWDYQGAEDHLISLGAPEVS